MTVVLTESIWSLTPDNLLRREAQLTPDDQPLVNESDLPGPLYIEAGLIPADVIVFLGFSGLSQQPKVIASIGYLATHVDRDGSGILVAGDMIATDPSTWVNARIHDLWRDIQARQISFGDFGLHSLDRYLQGYRHA